MKKVLTGLLCFCLLMCCIGTGFAEDAQYANTIAFLKLLEDSEIPYVVRGIDEDGDERVNFNIQGEKVHYGMSCYFNANNNFVDIHAWNIISFREEDLNKVVYLVNAMNYTYSLIKWYVDETDYTVNASYSLLLNEGEQSGELVFGALVVLDELIDAGYETLEAFDQGSSGST